MKILDYTPLIERLRNDDVDALADALPLVLEAGLDVTRYGDIPRWKQSLESLPDITISDIDMASSSVRAGVTTDCNDAQSSQLQEALMGLHPWRKGPFAVAGIDIDTEWRSDFKWDRLKDKIQSLEGRRVLDVGCGSGYHCWRMAAAGAELVVGIDPTPLFVMQYWAMQKYLQNPNVWVVPMRMEALPEKLKTFDTVFSMGILYHRRSPFDHLQELRDALVNGGQLVLETLVIEGDDGEVLVPEGRYSKMGNVWFIPSVPTLCGWLAKMKFRDVEVIDVSTTTVEEQRATDWMTFHSLSDFLDPDDPTKTAEGHPAPRRVVVVATA
ncbi:MAG: tRNA 5-methoxyuridine(34)/uridine 5-oxyacetic acid(34) synthase CmoB [Cellvibrionales bacterium]|nr:tRNA 5-methoxyuridine(34)/uridine 5-oxyacetic acid(34) synthase CmoB [Cellvibrionales bacterium]